MKKIVIAGGAGFLGGLLARFYSGKGDEVIILSRKHIPDRDLIRYVKWDGKTPGHWVNEIEGADVLINLTGRSVDCRYNEKNKTEIYDSRINSTYILGVVIGKLKKPPAVWLNASSATIYRHAEDRPMDEASGELGTGFSVDVCKKWESTFNNFQVPGVRKVILRIGIVLDSKSGALMPMTFLTKLGLGGRHGHGRQYFTWIHQKDFIRSVEYLIGNEECEGVFNITAPHPVRNRDFVKTLRKAQRAPFGLPMPAWMLEIGAFLIKTETELLLKSRWVVPKRLQAAGFQFDFPDLNSAINNLFSKDLKN